MLPSQARIELIDVARGVALIAMAIYHFTWDLDFFGYIEPGISVIGGWKIFARSIACSFLFLVGFSLYLAHGGGFRARSFLKRLAVIAAAAAAITIVTYVIFPESFIFFGILHHIALATVLGVAVLRLPAVVILLVAAGVIAAPHFVHAPFLDHPMFWWTGLSRNVPASNDFIPIFPWFGAVLLGIATAKIMGAAGLLARLAEIRPGRKLPLLAATGRHSLAFYLLHQPILIACVWLFAQVMPPDRSAAFMQACTAQCIPQREEIFCRAYCGCVVEEAAAQDRLGDIFVADPDAQTRAWLEDLALQCSVENNG
ncbi:heparan-alpha-glucosaminide N-acetyltransferase [Chelativorans sp. AA-79]|uniref:DUF1624 domain-containing protein n=1 Tax=Chelativorans sp. AA-79 TaxID=3028735 RepID=UPI0023F7DF45|nr:heparan-alpha-glucosaminide N-acetyltransferase [Chelativorans sp. AA-79]WEX11633.1 heparan-alpha-glucosaminide N-acetyltransferase [Chelativorans sp. AA-79]